MLDGELNAIPDDPQALVRMLQTETVRRDPHPYYDRLRELAPVFKDADSGMWYLTGWEPCNRVLRSDRFGQGGRIKLDPRYETSSSLRLLGENLTGMDAPEHTRLRFLASQGLSRPVVETMRQYLHALTAQVLDELSDRDAFDVVADYAARIPNTVICEMLGVPREDHEQFGAWLADQFRLLSPIPPTDELLAEVDVSVNNLEDYLAKVIDERRRAPRTDLISAFIASDTAAGDRMTPREVVVMTLVLLGGGSDTTKTVISMGVRALLQNAAERQKLIDSPAIDNKAFEELIRMCGPVLVANPRISFDDIEIGGHAVRAGEMVAPVLIAANFDPAVFPDPHRLNLERSPNPHLSFGHGAHICVGNMLARMVGMHAMGSLIRRFPDLQLVDDRLDARVDLFALRGVKSLHVRRV
jgi:cytochrome P450